MTTEEQKLFSEKTIRNKIKAEERILELQKQWEAKTGRKVSELKPSHKRQEAFFKEQLRFVQIDKDQKNKISREQLNEDYKELFGEYPHHAKKNETIQQEIEDKLQEEDSE